MGSHRCLADHGDVRFGQLVRAEQTRIRALTCELAWQTPISARHCTLSLAH